ncbi:MAG: NUDIX domain-containing protein [Bacteroidales bacterium]|nr:NUDIX domain-containing protein [Bacteroidales bacterium]
MLTIYLADRQIKLTAAGEEGKTENVIQVAPGQAFPFWEYFNKLLSASAEKELVFSSSDIQWLFRFIASFFEPSEAAGGLVKDEKGQLLFIFRQGKWDLPKGHTEKNESIEETALREVEEECGIDQLKIIKSLPTTYHVFELKKDRWVMKKTWWYLMHTKTKKEPRPQTNEQIEIAKWFERGSLNEIFENTYGSVKEVVRYAIELKLA